MASPTRDVSISDSGIAITAGQYDTGDGDGIALKVAGDTYPRLLLTPQGDVKQGDGTASPEVTNASRLPIAVTATDENEDDTWLVTIPYVNAETYVLADFAPPSPANLVFLVPDMDDAGSFTVYIEPLTDDGNVVSITVADLTSAYSTDRIGPGIEDSLATYGACISFQNAGPGNAWTITTHAGRYGAEVVGFAATTAGDWSPEPDSVESALDQLAARVYALENL